MKSGFCIRLAFFCISTLFFFSWDFGGKNGFSWDKSIGQPQFLSFLITANWWFSTDQRWRALSAEIPVMLQKNCESQKKFAYQVVVFFFHNQQVATLERTYVQKQYCTFNTSHISNIYQLRIQLKLQKQFSYAIGWSHTHSHTNTYKNIHTQLYI